MNRGRIVFSTGLVTVAVATGFGLAITGADRVRLEAGVRQGRAQLDEIRRASEAEARAVAAEAMHAAEQRAEAARLNEEIASLRHQLAQRSAAASRSPAPATSAAPVNPWPNAGRRDPLAAFQTVQWAIHEGDLDALEGLLAFDEAALVEAQDFFDRLDPESQAEFRSPERLIAAAVAAKSRTGIDRAAIVGTEAASGSLMSARVQISGSRVKARDITLRFEQAADGWRLQVPASVVTGYRNLLLGPEVDPYSNKFVR